MPFNALLRQCRHPSRNLTVNWNVGNPNLHGWRNQRSSFAREPVEKTFSLECCDVLHDGCLAGESEMVLDLASARRDACVSLLAWSNIKEAPFALREPTARWLTR